MKTFLLSCFLLSCSAYITNCGLDCISSLFNVETCLTSSCHLQNQPSFSCWDSCIKSESGNCFSLCQPECSQACLLFPDVTSQDCLDSCSSLSKLDDPQSKSTHYISSESPSSPPCQEICEYRCEKKKGELQICSIVCRCKSEPSIGQLIPDCDVACL